MHLPPYEIEPESSVPLTWSSLLAALSHAIGPERLGPHITQRVLWRASSNERIICLSFDDGPHPEFTPQLLDILAASAVPATFFCVGRYVNAYPAIVRHIAASGHEIGNHTFTHRMLPFLSDDEIRMEIRATHEAILESAGRVPEFIRPPMGIVTRRAVTVAEQLGYRTIIGDVYPRDPHRPGTARIVRRILKRVRPGSVIILHDGGNTRRVDRSQTLESVRTVVPALLERGFRFVTAGEMFRHHRVIAKFTAPGEAAPR